MTDDETALTTAIRHARRNLVPAWPGRKCIDSRYEPGQATGMIARPGADLGYVVALLAVGHERELGLTPVDAVDAVYDALTADGGYFFIHTDERTGLPDPAVGDAAAPIGCRHVAAAADPAHASAYFPSSYQRSTDDVRAAVAAVVRRLADGAHVHNVILRGMGSPHGVLVVTGTNRTINPSCAQSSYYVYDRTRDDAFVADVLVPRLAIDGLTADDLIAVSRRQLAASLRVIALGEPVFTVDVDGVEPIVTPAGCVEASTPWTAESGIQFAESARPPMPKQDAPSLP